MQTVGNAISYMLLVETILHARRGWSARDWSEAHTDMPNRQMKVNIEQRTHTIQTIKSYLYFATGQGC